MTDFALLLQLPWPTLPPNNKGIKLSWGIPVDRERAVYQAEMCVLALDFIETSQTRWDVSSTSLYR